jgi:hypothetical protein
VTYLYVFQSVMIIIFNNIIDKLFSTNQLDSFQRDQTLKTIYYKLAYSHNALSLLSYKMNKNKIKWIINLSKCCFACLCYSWVVCLLCFFRLHGVLRSCDHRLLKRQVLLLFINVRVFYYACSVSFLLLICMCRLLCLYVLFRISLIILLEQAP